MTKKLKSAREVMEAPSSDESLLDATLRSYRETKRLAEQQEGIAALRDRFAMAALTHVAITWPLEPDNNKARMAYELADAMLAERGKK